MHTITYEVSGVTSTCEVEVVSAPSAVVVSETQHCANDSPSSLAAETTGGTWSGGGVFGTLFVPSVVMPGTIWVAYTVGLG
jgi:hypothetical protein